MILIVDDTPFNILVMKSLLNFAENVKIDVTTNGEMTIEKVK